MTASNSPIPVVVNGAAGKMGRETIKAIDAAEDMTLVGAIDANPELLGQDIGEIAGCGPLEVPVLADLQSTLVVATQEQQQGVMVDFTHPSCVYENVRAALAYGVRPVVGTTGLSDAQIADLAEFAEKASTGCAIVPNFAIGVVLMQQAAVQAARYFDNVEIIERHHDSKADAPSGTAIQTAQAIVEDGKKFNEPKVQEKEVIDRARGAIAEGDIRIHSLRVPGSIAHQEVIFGSPGQIYTIRHDTSDRGCYMPGVLLAIRKVTGLKQLVFGLEKLL
ncbi:MAG: 4-hydroxy-tetrahydrodipicolinate reductase [Geitlerinemataceae cyanobacterium]